MDKQEEYHYVNEEISFDSEEEDVEEETEKEKDPFEDLLNGFQIGNKMEKKVENKDNWKRFLYLRKKTFQCIKDKTIKKVPDFEHFLHSEIAHILHHISFNPDTYIEQGKHDCKHCLRRLEKSGFLLRWIHNHRSIPLLKKCRCFYIAANLMIEVVHHLHEDVEEARSFKALYAEQASQLGLSLEHTKAADDFCEDDMEEAEEEEEEETSTSEDD
jgi:hypothetical protein